jgi:quercetin dioxygenase-like cupin family protein
MVEASGPPGSVTPVHSRPGSEAVYVLAGEQTFRGPHGVVGL